MERPDPISRRVSRRLRAWLRIAALLQSSPPGEGVHVYYGYPRLAGSGEAEHGGIIKFQRMQDVFPNSPDRFNVLYLVSSRLPPEATPLARVAKRTGRAFVLNQNGVAYPGWHGPGWERTNAPMRSLVHTADHVFYQSQFSQLGADRYLGPRTGSHEVLYNSVDTRVFTPASGRARGVAPVLLLAGTQAKLHRAELAVRTLSATQAQLPGAKLVIAGRLAWRDTEAEAREEIMQLAQSLGVADQLTCTGAFVQSEAPRVFQQADLLLHTKYNDPCPGVVIEAMACGLPVVHSASGGLPELVSLDAGFGVPAEPSWEKDLSPDPESLAGGVAAVWERIDTYSQAARERAVQKFDLQPWVSRHREVFEALI